MKDDELNGISIENFNEFTYSKRKHFDNLFFKKNYGIKLYNKLIDINNCRLKVYQDLLILSFIIENIPKKSKILEIGGGDSRIINHLKNEYQCYNIDKLEGLGNGPEKIDTNGFLLVPDYMGNFNAQLANNSFDFVFSISALEHVPIGDVKIFENIYHDIQRVLKPGGFSLHAFDVVIKKTTVWSNPFLFYLFDNSNPINSFIPFDEMIKDDDLFMMSESFYKESWQLITKKSYCDFGKPLSYNILWQK